MKLAAFLQAQALARPEKAAVVCGDSRLTFGELHETSSRLATALRHLGIGVGDRIAMCLPNDCEFVTVFLAIVKCGAVALPINMRLSTREIAAILQDAEPAVLFCGANERARIVEIAGANHIRRIVVGAAAQADEQSYGKLLERQAEAVQIPPEHDDCMISYTSGTTGEPKGVITTQANYIVANGFLNAIHWQITQEDRILITTPLAHRTGFARVGNMLVLGCTLFVVPRFEAEAVSLIIERERITLLGVVPTIGRMLLPTVEANSSRFQSLRVLVATGEAFPLEVKRRLLQALPQLNVFSFFAMTEAGALAMLRPEEQLAHGESVGRVTPGVDIRLVGADGRDVAAGEAGEIWARSGLPGQYLIFRGYYRREAATREAFEEGWFKTGDIGRFDAAGFLHIVDRKKDMVLSGGYNIYSKEVELTLCRHPAVADAAVVGVPDETFGEAVAAFIEREPGITLTESALIAWCATEFTGYKKPKYIVFLDSLPRNSTGKVLKNELRRFFGERVSVRR